jgi:hypothetical protein
VVLVLVGAAAAGCGSGKSPPVKLEGGTDAAGGKAMVFSASTDKQLASIPSGYYALELRGVDLDSGDTSFYRDKHRCVFKPCEWTVAPTKAATYQFKAYLINLRTNKDAGASKAVKVDWTPPPRPEAIKLFVNGTTPRTVPLDGESYVDFPPGPLQVEAKWTTDAGGTGYYVKISDEDREYARCSTGTSCLVQSKIPLKAAQELELTLELRTTKGDKVVGGFKVCLDGKSASA